MMNLKYLLRAMVVISAAATLAGCAHDITISGDPSALITNAAGASSAETFQPISKTVGLVIPDELRTKEVITPGGGGDKVSYKPYRDLELPLYIELGQIFTKVVRLNAIPDQATIHADNLSYVITPTITTTSSSDSLLTWPATDFTVTLTCSVVDPDSKLVTTKEVTGSGHADFSEFMKNFGLAGQRASIQAIQKLGIALKAAPELRQ